MCYLNLEMIILDIFISEGETSSIQQMYLAFEHYRESHIFKDVGDKGLSWHFIYF